MNYLLTEDKILDSKFFLFFISCCNLVKFYAKKDKEYNPKVWEKWISTKTEIPVKPKNTQREPVPVNKRDLNSKEESQKAGDSTRMHHFLEGCSPILLSHQKQVDRVFRVIEELKNNLKLASSNMKELGELFSTLGEGYAEIEKANQPELAKVRPSLSHLYLGLKKSVFQMSNSLEQRLNIFKRFFERSLTDISENMVNVVSTIGIRDESVKRLMINVEMSKQPELRTKHAELVIIVSNRSLLGKCG